MDCFGITVLAGLVFYCHSCHWLDRRVNSSWSVHTGVGRKLWDVCIILILCPSQWHRLLISVNCYTAAKQYRKRVNWISFPQKCNELSLHTQEKLVYSAQGDLKSCIKWNNTDPHHVSLFLLPAVSSHDSKCSDCKSCSRNTLQHKVI